MSKSTDMKKEKKKSKKDDKIKIKNDKVDKDDAKRSVPDLSSALKKMPVEDLSSIKVKLKFEKNK